MHTYVPLYSVDAADCYNYSNENDVNNFCPAFEVRMYVTMYVYIILPFLHIHVRMYVCFLFIIPDA